MSRAVAVRLAGIFAAALFVYGYRVWDAPLDRTEPHRALVAHEMVVGGDWLVPHLNGEVYLRKPPLMYWVEALAEKGIGRAEPWVWRLPSVVGSALLAATVAAWAGWWFGVVAVVPAGLAVLSLVPLFDQDRAADIDALNTAAAVVTSLFALELLYGPRRRAWPRAVGLAISTAAVLLLKGPGGLPPLVGALVGPSLVLRDWRWVRRPGVWVALLIGVAAFVSWGVAAKAAVRHAGVATDNRGVREALQRLVLHRWRDVLPALVAPVTVLAYAVPASLAVPFAVLLIRRGPAPAAGTPGGGGIAGDSERREPLLRPGPRRSPVPASGQREKLIALLATITTGLLLFVIAGNGNPRYEYVLLPLLGMVVGGVAGGWDRLTATERRVVGVGLGLMVPLWGWLQGIITTVVWRAGVDHVGLAVAGVASAAATAAWFARRRPVTLLGLIVVLLAVPLADRKNLERQRRSTIQLAGDLRAIVGRGPVVVASENWDVPELFWYAGVTVRSFGEGGLERLAAEPGSHWVVLGQTSRFSEYRTLTQQVPGAFPDGIHRLRLPKGDTLYVGRYDPPASVSRTVRVSPVPPDVGDDE